VKQAQDKEVHEEDLTLVSLKHSFGTDHVGSFVVVYRGKIGFGDAVHVGRRQSFDNNVFCDIRSAEITARCLR
jgi:hypothetical protein